MKGLIGGWCMLDPGGPLLSISADLKNMLIAKEN